jgi:hypothetical protein
MTTETSRPIKCRTCRYDVAHMRTGRCPECGTPLTPTQRKLLGLPPIPRHAEQMLSLAERLRGKESMPAEISDVLELDAAHPDCLDDKRVMAVLRRSKMALRIYRVLRRSGEPPAESLISALEAVLCSDGDRLTDEAAIRLLPTSRTCRDIYRKLRQLGHEPIEAIVRILPHAASFTTRPLH